MDKIKMSVIKYKKVEPNNISLTKPSKINGSYISNIKYSSDNEKLLIQTPVIDLNSSTEIKFSLVNKGQLFSVLEEINEKIIDILYTNSVKFFNGKEFSENKIRESLSKIVSLDDNGVATINNTSIGEKVKIYDMFKDTYSDIKFPVKASCIIHIESLIFKGKKIIPTLKVTHVKIDYKTDKKKLQNCILDSEEDDTPVEVIETPEEQLDELDNILEKPETENFFDDE